MYCAVQGDNCNTNLLWCSEHKQLSGGSDWVWLLLCYWGSGQNQSPMECASCGSISINFTLYCLNYIIIFSDLLCQHISGAQWQVSVSQLLQNSSIRWATGVSSGCHHGLLWVETVVSAYRRAATVPASMNSNYLFNHSKDFFTDNYNCIPVISTTQEHTVPLIKHHQSEIILFWQTAIPEYF